MFQLGCSNLIGTKMLKKYMHGYLMHLKLYNKHQEKINIINSAAARQKKIADSISNEAPVRVETKEVVEDPRFMTMKDNPEFFEDKHS